MSLLEANPVYKPFRYPWAYDAWLTQQRVHWLPEEVPLADDVKDWHNKMTAEERNLLTQIFRFFTQSDIEVANCYMKQYSRVFELKDARILLHVAISDFDIRLREEAKNLRQQVPFFCRHFIVPILHVIGERHLFWQPVNPLLREPSIIGPRITERFINRISFK